MNLMAEVKEEIISFIETTGKYPKKVQLGNSQKDRFYNLPDILTYDRSGLDNVESIYKAKIEWIPTTHWMKLS